MSMKAGSYSKLDDKLLKTFFSFSAHTPTLNKHKPQICKSHLHEKIFVNNIWDGISYPTHNINTKNGVFETTTDLCPIATELFSLSTWHFAEIINS